MLSLCINPYNPIQLYTHMHVKVYTGISSSMYNKQYYWDRIHCFMKIKPTPTLHTQWDPQHTYTQLHKVNCSCEHWLSCATEYRLLHNSGHHKCDPHLHCSHVNRKLLFKPRMHLLTIKGTNTQVMYPATKEDLVINWVRAQKCQVWCVRSHLRC